MGVSVRLREVLDQCHHLGVIGDTHGGLLLWDQLLAEGVRGQFLVDVLRYKALFLVRSDVSQVALAISCLKEALALTRRHPSRRAAILEMLVQVYALAGSSDLAQSYMDQLVKLAAERPVDSVLRRLPRAWFSMGGCYEAAGEYHRAAEAYQSALKAGPFDADGLSRGMVQLNLGQVLLALGRVEEAGEALGEARPGLNMERWGGHLLEEEARFLLAQGRHQEAWSRCQEALQHPACCPSTEAHVYYTMGCIALAQARYEEAARCTEQALHLAFMNPEVRLLHSIETLRAQLLMQEEVS